MSLAIYSLLSGPARRLNLRTDAFDKLLIAGWAEKKITGVIQGRPEGQELTITRIGPYEVGYAPWRTNQQGKPGPEPEVDINEPHTSQGCPFCNDDRIEQQRVALVVADKAVYYLMVNFRPCREPHWLLVRHRQADNSELSQLVHNAAELDAVSALHQLLPAEMNIGFNSHNGHGNGAGSSVSHLHFQIFAFGTPAQCVGFHPLSHLSSNGNIGFLIDWPAANRVFRGRDCALLANQYLAVVQAANNAFNLAFFRYPGEPDRLAVFPRALASPTILFRGHYAYPNQGCDAVTGSMMSETNGASFMEMQQYPAEAELVLTQRLREITSSPDRLAQFDH